LFEIYRRKIEQKKQKAIARVKQIKKLVEKTIELIKKKTQLEMNLMRRESEARIRVAVGLGFGQKFPPNPWVWVRSGWVFK
jgi:hypothetical protein